MRRKAFYTSGIVVGKTTHLGYIKLGLKRAPPLIIK